MAMSINDNTFAQCEVMRRNGETFRSPDKVAGFLAGVKKNIVNAKAKDYEHDLWNKIPNINAGVKVHDVVKDFSVDSTHGHAGVVTDTATVVKRDGRRATKVQMTFANHTNVGNPRTRTVEIIHEQENNQ